MSEVHFKQCICNDKNKAQTYARLVERVSGHKNMYGESEMSIDLSQNEVQVIILTV